MSSMWHSHSSIKDFKRYHVKIHKSISCYFIFNIYKKLSGNFNFQDMMIWETIGLWHYSIPGLFLLAQFCLGVFVALCNLVNNSVFLYLTSEEGPSLSNDHHIDGMCVIL
jgi:hypothetical protein